MSSPSPHNSTTTRHPHPRIELPVQLSTATREPRMQSEKMMKQSSLDLSEELRESREADDDWWASELLASRSTNEWWPGGQAEEAAATAMRSWGPAPTVAPIKPTLWTVLQQQ
ncbi:hypothetical protein C2845_PM04G23240 [Panicum miliaceum]|uniref:Uncharacterized protein n=1 Tax=Panicum miliaceum TaxID=4540 RepID=A0A3L6QP73_PANMI|nr:hypothetical protein C2845_PM04G23240 [Panicum miliaceum]